MHHNDVILYLLVCPFLIKLFVFRCFIVLMIYCKTPLFKVEA